MEEDEFLIITSKMFFHKDRKMSEENVLDKDLETQGALDGDDTLLDLDSVDNMAGDEIEDVAGFVEPPTGLYRLKCTKAASRSYSPKKGDNANKKVTQIRFMYSIVKVIELDDKKELIPPETGMFSEQFQGTKQGMKYWKFKAKALLAMENFGKATVKEINDKITDSEPEFDAKVTCNKTKNDDGTTFTNINVRVIDVKSPSLEGGAPVGAGGGVNI